MNPLFQIQNLKPRSEQEKEGMATLMSRSHKTTFYYLHMAYDLMLQLSHLTLSS